MLVILLQFGCKGSYNDKHPSVVGDIKDNAAWYPKVTGGNVLEASVTIPVPNDFTCKPYDDLNASARPCTLKDIEMDKNPYDNYKPQIHVVYANQDYSAFTPNASMKQKGKSTRRAKQASFRIILDKNRPLYRGERTFNLNKHPYDRSRIRNMLSFELFQSIPNFTSLRTQFVHLMVYDENGTKNYGLFTHIEQCDKLYLKNHGFSSSDNLYKAQNYYFQMTDALKIDAKGKPLNKDAFDASLEMQNGKDREKVVAMTQAVTNARTNKEFEKVFNKYFNRNNYLTWFAINIVLDNKDTITQNFFLLNPALSDKFYFLPWDYDGIAHNRDTAPKWSKGIANWWASPLHRKFLKIKKNRDDLDAMVHYLREKYITDEKIHALMDKYKPLVEPYVKSLPDSAHMNGDWDKEFAWVRNEMVPGSMRDYEACKGDPMPFWQSYEYKNDDLVIGWGRSYDLEHDPIVYDITLATDPEMENKLLSLTNVKEKDLNMTKWGDIHYDTGLSLEPGTYFLKIVAKQENDPSKYQIALDQYRDEEEKRHDGVMEIIIE